MKILFTLFAGLFMLFGLNAGAQAQSAADRYAPPSAQASFGDDYQEDQTVQAISKYGKEYDENDEEEDDLSDADKEFLHSQFGDKMDNEDPDDAFGGGSKSSGSFGSNTSFGKGATNRNRPSSNTKSTNASASSANKQSDFSSLADEDDDEEDMPTLKKQTATSTAKKKTAAKGKKRNTKRLLPEREHEYIFRTPQNNSYLFKKETIDATILNRQKEERNKKSGSKQVISERQRVRERYVVDLSTEVKPFDDYRLTEEGTIYRGKTIEPKYAD